MSRVVATSSCSCPHFTIEGKSSNGSSAPNLCTSTPPLSQALVFKSMIRHDYLQEDAQSVYPCDPALTPNLPKACRSRIPEASSSPLRRMLEMSIRCRPYAVWSRATPKSRTFSTLTSSRKAKPAYGHTGLRRQSSGSPGRNCDFRPGPVISKTRLKDGQSTAR